MKWFGLVAGLLLTGLVQAQDLNATLAWSKRVELGVPVSGPIAEVNVRSGQTVQAGDSLLWLDSRLFKAQVSETRAAVARNRAQHEEARRELDRTQELYDRTLLSEHELQLAQIAAATAAADLQSARAQLAAAELDLEYATLKAPFAGRIVKVMAHAGEAVVNTQRVRPLVVLADHKQMLARALITADRLAAFQSGQAVSVQVGSQRFEGRVSEVSLEALAGGQYELLVVFDPPADHDLRAGQPVTLRPGR